MANVSDFIVKSGLVVKANTTIPATGNLVTTNTVRTSARPTLDFNFARSPVLDNRITFFRPSIGTYIGRDGYIKYAGVNQPRFDYDPITGQSNGLLIEEQRTNLVPNSNPAIQVSSGASATRNAGAAPDGSNDSVLLTVLASGSNSPHWDIGGISITTSSIYTASIYVKPNAGNTWISFILYTPVAINGARAWFNVANGTIGTIQTNGAATNVSATIQQLQNGWYRCVVAAQPNGSDTTINWEINLTSANGLYQQNGTAGQSMFFWGPQLETPSVGGGFGNNVVTSFIPTNGSQATRSVDVVCLNPTFNTYDPTSGTIYIDLDANNQNASFAVYIPTLGEIVTVRSTTSVGTWNGILQVDATTVNANLVTGARFAISYSATQRNMVLSGGAITTNQSGFTVGFGASINAPIQIFLGNQGSNGRVINGHVRRFTYWPELLPNSQLQQMTLTN